MVRFDRRSLLSLAALALVSVVSGCSPSSSSSSSSSSGGASSGGPGGSGSDGGNGSGAAPGALPSTTFLYLEASSSDTHTIVAYDLSTKERRVVSDLRGDGSSGWAVDGLSISPDRTRVVITSLYGPTQQDAATKVATNRVWTLAPDGTDFRRLTPVFANTAQGRSGFTISVRSPVFTKDAADVLYSYGEYWYEGTNLKGASQLWRVAAAGGGVPELLPSQPACSVLSPSIDPKTGALLAIHSVCAQGKDGLYLYPPDGGAPRALVEDGDVMVSLETPSWAADGSGFVFVGVTSIVVGGSTQSSRGLFAYDMDAGTATLLVLPEAQDETVRSAALAPNASAIVYCLRKGKADDLHVIDLTANPPTDTPLTTGGVSCHPAF